MEELLTLKVLNDSVENIIYSIDTPRTGSLGSGKSEYIRFSGWLYTLDGAPASFIFSHSPEVGFYPSTIRTDVQSVHPLAPVVCGVVAPVEFSRSFKIGVKFGDVSVWVAEVEITSLKVLRGKNRNLFLDNDANQSVSQYRGGKLISSEEMTGWDQFFHKVGVSCNDLQIKCAFMVAPAKEFVYPEDFPFEKGIITPLEQFIVSFSDKVKMVNPLLSLMREKEFTYFKTDTHWTEYGAFLAAQLVCAEFKVPLVTPDLTYVIKPKLGDLGSKMYPPQAESSLQVHNVDVLKRFEIFDNGVPVRGNVRIYENPITDNISTLLIYGDSFSVDLADFLSHSFTRVVRVFSGADLDWSIIANEKPDYILIELASRFLVRAPEQEFALLNEIQGKYEDLSGEVIDRYLQRFESNDDKRYSYYTALSIEALNKVKISHNSSIDACTQSASPETTSLVR